jgi:hypothetical protein
MYVMSWGRSSETWIVERTDGGYAELFTVGCSG